ncbi:class I adenylate-forming enzyme family protein [Sphingomonas sp. S2-65]|uniref:class I adenylate-forming enzyme family protein n=1 Tax=Sphingomonas sp. S2-65 TaxID=2903960 RepID=UPI001F1B5B04|nr:class I adenylate-forming enzyme family protein [Sphingomonas sp. S2-65]UYY58851.1 acyl--CoA ligase [Sphingomonas sp. S2-65]
MGQTTSAAEVLLGSDFANVADLIRAHGRERPDKPAIVCGDERLSYAALDRGVDRVAAALQRDGLGAGTAVVILGSNSVAFGLIFLGALRAGCVPAPLATSATPDQLAAMVRDCAAPIAFVDAEFATLPLPARTLRLDALDAWLAPKDAQPLPVPVGPEHPFNIIYSSGTTGTPKGIVQPHAMRWFHIARAPAGFDSAVTLVATPLYSNTTLVSFLPTLGWGGTVVLMPRFDAREFLVQAERHRATVAMLVPVQYQRILALPDFDRFDLSSFRLKTCSSAPCPATLKADILARWPGLLVEYYGMSEGGGTTILVCNAHPAKLHTVGTPLPGHDIRIIDDEGRELPPGDIGEVVGRSAAMMTGYHGREEVGAAAFWHDAEGRPFIRHGDLGRFDEDGFLTLVDRKKDLIISGGFNVFPSDLEAVLVQHPQVEDCAVIGVPSERWGETPAGFFVGAADPDELLAWCNARLGKTQRLSRLHPIADIPRNALGKILKRALRGHFTA